ncbi:MAG: ABC transporter ATP-binding protein [Flavobacteriales bacterium]|jgi:lipopolysaccharide transport system ATP-binding protein|nr:MAG: ABC transporter ATP-binding protein [Flavobacteriales bacterium]
MSGEAPLIRVEGLSKKFCTDLRTSLKYGVQDLAAEVVGRERNHELRTKEFWALQDVGFELRRGECLGLLGRNGAGKTTLLKMLNGLMKPDKGRIELRGRIGALIALGAGFNPVLTGRENIFVNAAVLGIPRQVVRQRLDEVVAFAELEQFIDMPVQNYSSGMNVRLGFSVAAVLLEPDILFLDEVLAVGDIGFAMKCLNRVREIMAHSAVIFVSHSMPMVSTFCTRALVMQKGQLMMDTTNLGEAMDRYMSAFTVDRRITGTGGAEVLDLQLLVDDKPLQDPEPVVDQGKEGVIELTVRVDQGEQAGVSVFVDDIAMSQVLAVTAKDQEGRPIVLGGGVHRLRIPLGKLEMNMGTYSILVGVKSFVSTLSLCRVQGLRPFRVRSQSVNWSKIVREQVSTILPA